MLCPLYLKVHKSLSFETVTTCHDLVTDLVTDLVSFELTDTDIAPQAPDAIRVCCQDPEDARGRPLGWGAYLGSISTIKQNNDDK